MEMKLLLIAAFLALARAARADHVVVSPQDRIYNGQIINITELPEMAYMGCGASIIHPRFVLTAAHCCRDPNKRYTVMFATNHFWNVTVTRKVVKNYEHELWNASGYYDGDYRILELDEDIPIDNVTMKVFNLPIHNGWLPKGEELYVAGYGYTRNATAAYGYLRRAKMIKTSREECTKAWGRENPYILCTTEPPGDVQHPCSGDSGGPLYTKNHTLVGVVSHGVDCTISNHSYFSRVSIVIPWIRGIIDRKGKN